MIKSFKVYCNCTGTVCYWICGNECGRPGVWLSVSLIPAPESPGYESRWWCNEEPCAFLNSAEFRARKSSNKVCHDSQQWRRLRWDIFNQIALMFRTLFIVSTFSAHDGFKSFPSTFVVNLVLHILHNGKAPRLRLVRANIDMSRFHCLLAWWMRSAVKTVCTPL